MEKIKAIIIDDEVLARENLAMLIENFCPEVQILAKSQSVNQAYEDIVEHTPDLIFLDIRMPSGTEGFDLLTKFDNPKFLVIFVTAFKDYAVEAMNANAIHYILKPIDIDELELAVKKVIQLKTEIKSDHQVHQKYMDSLKQVYQQFASKRNKRISIRHSKGIKLIDVEKIVYVMAKSNCSEIYLSDGSTYLDTRTLAIYESILPESIFYRIHRSVIINLQFLEEYRRDRGSYALMTDGSELPIAKKRLSAFIEKIS